MSAGVQRESQGALGWFRDVVGTQQRAGRTCGILCRTVLVSGDCHSGHTSSLYENEILLGENTEVLASGGGVPQGWLLGPVT